MEKRQLDFNAPLLSARRFSSPRNSSELVQQKVIGKQPPHGRQQSLPLNKYELESEDISKPASVPFHWEQSPGLPKNEAQTHFPTSNTPRLPPGRLSSPSKYNSGERSNDQKNISFTNHASLLEKLDENLKCKDELNSESQEDDAYLDVLNTLSLAETCSVSGISGYQNSGTFCVDKQTRDFMMDRFLPAAKAAILETPQYAVKKEVKKMVSGEVIIKPSIRKYGSDAILPYYGHGFDNVEREDEDNECSVPVKKSGKSWGVLPRICVKSALCLLNPVPAMKSKSRPPTPSAGEERRLRRNSVSGPLDKNGCQVPPPKKKYHSGLLSRDLPGFENKLSNDSYPLLDSRESPRSGFSPLRRYRSRSISPYRNESPKSPFREGAGFLGVPKEVENFNASKIASSRKLFRALQDVSRTQMNEKGSSGPAGDPVEKTVYVDSINNYAVKSDKEEGKKMSSLKYADEVRDIKLYLSLDRESRVVECDEVGNDVKLGINEEGKLGLLDNGGECDLTLKSPSPPPLPKSPSESWLWRTLPSIPLGNPFAHSRRNSQQHRKGSGDDTKWETIVKSSKLRHHDHACYSEELIPHASYRQSKS